MQSDSPTLAVREGTVVHEEEGSAVTWSAIFAGAAAALALSLTLVGLAAGMGLRVASPWPYSGRDFADFSPMAGAWLIAIQVVSASLGGYLAGRLRTKWRHVHTHEAHFRDTAHGLLVWAVSTVAGVVLIASATPASRIGETAIAEAVATQDYARSPAVASDTQIRADAERAASLAAQEAFFVAFGLLLSAFSASVAAAVGGLRRDEMVEKYWVEARRAP